MSSDRRHTSKIINFGSKSKTLKKKKKINDDKKTCLTNQQVIDICKTGAFDTVSEFSLFSDENLAKIKKITDDPEKYKKLLIRKFNTISHGKDLNYATPLMKNDFYSFINKEWEESITNEKQMKFYVETDNFRTVQEKVYYKLIDYMNDYIKAHPHDKLSKALKNVYTSITNDTPASIRKKNCLKILGHLESYIQNDDMYGLLAHNNTNEVTSWGSPIVWTMAPDEKNVKKYISHLSLGLLSISDYLVYIQDDPSDNKEATAYKKLVKQEYFKHIKKVFNVCLGEESAKEYHAQDVWDVELELLDAMGCNVLHKPEDPNYYNLVTTEDLVKTYGFDFPQFAKKLGFKNVPKKVVVSSLNGLKCMTDLLKKNWNTPKWKTFWLFVHYRQMIRFEPSLRNIHYDFHEKLLQGQPVNMPLDIYPIFVLSLSFNTFFSNQYTEHNQNPLYVTYVNKLLNDLKFIFIRKLKFNKWLSPKTKAYAIQKMTKLEIVVGRPDKLREDPLIDYSSDYDSWHNIYLLTKWKHARFLELEGKDMVDIPLIDWKNFKIIGTQNYMVNAYYRPTSNSIYVPLAYLQSPFIDLNERGIEYNLAYIGYTLGHELSHALDDSGSRFDQDGNLNNWWTDHDRKIYNGKIRDVINQYETFARRDGITDWDASFSVGEDLADISGLALVEEYLLEFSKINDINSRLKRIKLEKFYSEIPVQGRQKVFKKAIKSQLRINPHPLEKYRSNCPLSRLELFRNIFNIKKTDGMWWHNSDTIW
jgi:putative endopeptidase